MVCLAGGGAAGNAAVAVGSLPGDDLAGAGPKQFAAPVAFGDLGFLVFGDHALHLGEQGGLRVVGGQPRGVGERHGDAEAVQLVEHQHLVGVGAGEPVRRQAPHPLRRARPRRHHAARPGRGGPVGPRNARRRRTRRPARHRRRRCVRAAAPAASRWCRGRLGARWTPAHTAPPSPQASAR